MEHWPFEKLWNPLDIILSQDIIDEQLTDIWLRAKMFSKGDDMSYFKLFKKASSRIRSKTEF